LRFFTDSDEDRLLIVNLGPDLPLIPAPEPLLAPVAGGSWALRWSSDHPLYGGPGIINPLSERGWQVPAASAALFIAAKPETPRS
jgi:maltooligosyltrehalose trehalohydrolase